MKPTLAMTVPLSLILLGAAHDACASPTPDPTQRATHDTQMRDAWQAPIEKKVLFGPESAPEWSAAESTLAASPEHAKVGKAALHWHVTVDYAAGEPNYPIGWPRINHTIPAGPARDWSGWDYLHMGIYAGTSREALPREPASLILYAPDRAAEFVRPLPELRKGEWVEINIPLAQIARHNDVRLLQFSISEANYRDRDRVDFSIDDLALIRYARPTLLEFAPESAVLFADAKRIPVQFRLAGVPAGERAEVTCELRREGRVAARAAVKAERGPARLVLDLGRAGLAPGTYELTARVAGSPQAATARVRLVEPPWR